MFNPAGKEYFGGSTDNVDKTEILFVHGSSYHMEAGRRQNIPAEMFLPQIHFHVVRLTVAHDITQWCRGEKTAALPSYNTACKGYHTSLIVASYNDDALRQARLYKCATRLVRGTTIVSQSRFTTWRSDVAQRQSKLYQRSKRLLKSTTVVLQSMAKRNKFQLFTVSLTIWRSIQGTKVGAYVLLWTDCHSVRLTVVDIMLTLCVEVQQRAL